MAEIASLVGDATSPKTPMAKTIVHVCNDTGAWGKGFVMSLSKRWSGPESQLRPGTVSVKQMTLVLVGFSLCRLKRMCGLQIC